MKIFSFIKRILTNIPEIADVTKRHVFQPNFSKNAAKSSENLFGFLDNGIWFGCAKFSLI